MARLPAKGEYDWGDVLNEYLSQSLNKDGTLVSGPKNPYHGGPNGNLANNSQAGLLRLTNDLTGTAGAPQVSGLQGKPVAPTQPQNGQALIWDEELGAWRPKDVATTSAATHARALTINSVGL